jgi:hypothetical protein
MSHAIAIRKRINFTGSKVIRNVQYHSFHGFAYRDPVTQKWSAPSFDDERIPSLWVIRDGNRFPAIFCPVRTLIVAVAVKEALAGFANLRFAQVTFAKLVDFA